MGRDFKNIKTWQEADNLVVMVYSKTKAFPKEELYGITSQIRRAAISVPTNISEGASREHKREYLHFLYVARGSMAELEYLLHLSHRLNFLEQRAYKELEDLRKEVAKMLYGLIISVKRETSFVSRVLALLSSTLVLYGFKVLSLGS